MTMHDPAAKSRRAAIREILKKKQVGTQEELRELVAARGFDVTQGTLSRDLQKLRARRVSLPEGGATYELDGDDRAAAAPAALVSAMQGLVTGIAEGDALVVMHTRPGAAPAIAAMLDQSKLSSIIGTLAGDDTVFVVPAKKVATRTLAKELSQRFATEAKGR
jgi:transcriptional regulator of arginine metabolism